MSTRTKASRMEQNTVAELKPQRFETGKALLIAGLKERYGRTSIRIKSPLALKSGCLSYPSSQKLTQKPASLTNL